MLPLRLGLRMVRSLSNEHAARILAARGDVPFTSIEDVWRRSGVPLGALERIAEADGFASLGADRRQALWQVKGLGEAPLPLFAAADERLNEVVEPEVQLTPMTEGREVVEDYRAIQLSLRAHPIAFLRPELDLRGLVPCASLKQIKDGRKATVAGIILIRQKPGSAKGVLFLTLEDESGIANVIIWPHKFETYRRTVLSSSMIAVRGTVQREGGAIHVIADHIDDYTPMLRSVGEMGFACQLGRGDGATNGGSPDRGEKGGRAENGWPKANDQFHKPFRTGADPETVLRQRTRDFH